MTGHSMYKANSEKQMRVSQNSPVKLSTVPSEENTSRIEVEGYVID